MTSFFLGVPVDAAYHLLSGFTSFLTPALGAAVAAVAAIVLFTVAIRLVLAPLSLRGLRGQTAAARLAPQLAALRKKHAKEPERLQREMTALYKREGTSMFAGLTPLLLQWPLLSVVYLLFRSGQIGGKPNTLLTRDLFGVPLGGHWLSGAGPVSAHGLVFVGVFVLLAGLCWLSVRLSKLMTPAQPAATPDAAPAGGALIRALPYLTLVFAAFVPLAAGIYLVVSTGWALAERTFFWRTGRITIQPAPELASAQSVRSQPGPRRAAGPRSHPGQGHTHPKN
jgi:YidC/Oxa1 family membrane protein insertase